MKKKAILFVSSVLLSLSSCQEPLDSSSIESSSQETTSQETSISSTTQEETSYYCTVIPDRYGTITTDKASYHLGEEVNITISSETEGVAPVAVVINNREIEASSGNVSSTMEENGLVIRGIYRRQLDDFQVESDFTSITAERIEGALYALDDGEFQEENVFTGLEPDSVHTVSCKLQAEDDLRESNIVTKTVILDSVEDVVASTLEALRNDITLKGSYSVDRYMEGSYVDTTVFDHEFHYDLEHYYLYQVFNDDKTVMEHVERVKGEDGKARVPYLDYDNTIYYSDTEEIFDNVYDNPFDYLDENDFVLTSDSRLRYVGNKTVFEDNISNFLTYDATELIDFYLVLDADNNLEGIEMYTELVNGGGSYIYDGTIRMEVVTESEIEICAPKSKSFDKTVLSLTLESLAQGNYTADIYDDNWRTDTHTTYVSDGEGVVVSPENGYRYGYHNTDSGLALFDVTSSGSQVLLKGRRGYPIQEESMRTLLPTFDINLNLFSQIDAYTYSLDGDLGLYSFASRLLPDKFLETSQGSDIVDGTLVISIANDVTITYDYKNIYGYGGTVTIELTDIGSTRIPFDFSSTYQSYRTPTSWEEFSPEFYNLLVEYIGDTSLLPFYWLSETEDNLENMLDVTFQEDLTFTMLELISYFPNWEKASYYLENYSKVLRDNGFVEGESYHFSKGNLSVFFSYPEIIYQEERSIFLWINRI